VRFSRFDAKLSDVRTIEGCRADVRGGNWPLLTTMLLS